MEALKMLISSMELGSQDEVLKALEKEGFKLTQATLSRDLKQLKVAKAASMNGKYVYVLPNDTMYKRISTPKAAMEMLQTSRPVRAMPAALPTTLTMPPSPISLALLPATTPS